jgi:hypothetical protein
LVEDFPLLTELALCPLGEIALHGFPAGHLLVVWLDHSPIEEPLTPVVPSLQVLVEGRREHAFERRLAGVRLAREQPDPRCPIVPVDEAATHEIKLLVARDRLAEPDRLRGLALDENGALPAVGAHRGVDEDSPLWGTLRTSWLPRLSRQPVLYAVERPCGNQANGAIGR